MRKAIVAFAGVAVLAAWGSTMATGQELSPEVKAQLCGEKKAGLARLEAEAPGLHAKVAQLESAYAQASALENKLLVPGLAGEIKTPRDSFLDNVTDAGTSGALALARSNREAVTKQLASAKERERYVGSQIFLLRDIIEGLGCDTPTPPVDLRAIDQHSQQFQQSQPGSQTTTGGQSVVPQGSYGAPSSGFGPSSGSTQPAGQQEQSPGYGPGPYGTGSPQFPTHEQILQGVQGSIGGEKPGMSKPGGG